MVVQSPYYIMHIYNDTYRNEGSPKDLWHQLLLYTQLYGWFLFAFSVAPLNIPAIAGGTVGGLIAVVLVVIIIVVAAIIIKQKNVKKG